MSERGYAGHGMGIGSKPWDWRHINGPARVALPEKMVVRGIASLAGGTVFFSLTILGLFGMASWVGIVLAGFGFFVGGVGVVSGVVLHGRGAEIT